MSDGAVGHACKQARLTEYPVLTRTVCYARTEVQYLATVPWARASKQPEAAADVPLKIYGGPASSLGWQRGGLKGMLGASAVDPSGGWHSAQEISDQSSHGLLSRAQHAD